MGLVGGEISLFRIKLSGSHCNSAVLWRSQWKQTDTVCKLLHGLPGSPMTFLDPCPLAYGPGAILHCVLLWKRSMFCLGILLRTLAVSSLYCNNLHRLTERDSRLHTIFHYFGVWG